jgi:hypothetical protein
MQSQQFITRKQAVCAKRNAMRTAFWAACPLDDDDGFDRLMAVPEGTLLSSLDWGSVYLHSHLDKIQVAQVQSLVKSTAIQLLCNLMGVSNDVAQTALASTRTTVPIDGVFTDLVRGC